LCALLGWQHQHRAACISSGRYVPCPTRTANTVWTKHYCTRLTATKSKEQYGAALAPGACKPALPVLLLEHSRPAGQQARGGSGTHRMYQHQHLQVQQRCHGHLHCLVHCCDVLRSSRGEASAMMCHDECQHARVTRCEGPAWAVTVSREVLAAAACVQEPCSCGDRLCVSGFKLGAGL
jgi:hypothetical protein